MKVIKPMKLGLIHRTVEFGRQFHFTVAVLVFFPLDQPRNLLGEIGLWKLVPKVLGKDAVLDEMVSKARGEVLVAGKAFAPNGVPAREVLVRVQVGPVDKRVAVVGDRFWQRGVPTEPAPFASMPITWDRAFGGEGFPQNPVGKGFAPVTVDGREVHALPNIEDPRRVIRTPRDRPDPVGLMPIDVTWPQRAAKAGTYDDEWFQNWFPGLARDVDWTMFNLAPQDQWLPGHFRGDEAFLVENMHPSKSRIEGTLPNPVVRVFANRRIGDALDFREIQTRVDTVWLFPEHERGVLVYRGVERVEEDDAFDVEHLLLAAEDPAQGRDVEYYRGVLAQRLDKERGPMLALRDDQLMPAWAAEAPPEVGEEMAAAETEGLLRRNAQRRNARETQRARDKVAAHGLDPDEHGPAMPAADEKPPPIDQLPDYARKLQARAEQVRADAEAKKAALDVELREKFARAGLDYAVIQREQTTVVGGPPRDTPDREVQRLRELSARARAAGVVLPDVEEKAWDPRFYQELVEKYRLSLVAYHSGVHFQPPAARRDDAESLALREAVMRARAAGQPLARVDLTGADLRGLDFSGADLTGSFLESTDLTGANLAGADLTGAVLAHANLSDANFARASLAGANVGRAKLHRADLSGANLAGAIAMYTDFTGAQLRRAALADVMLVETVLRDADLTDASASGLFFVKTDVAGVRFGAARLDGAVFVECNVEGVDFGAADLTGASFMNCRGRKSAFRGARAPNLRVQMESDFEEADFRTAKLEGANFRGTRLRRADFSGAVLNGADLSGCDLTGAKLLRTDARGVLAVRTDLTDADLTAADLMDAILQKSTIQGVNLRYANLYRADMARVKTDSRANLSNANLKKVRVNPKRVPT